MEDVTGPYRHQIVKLLSEVKRLKTELADERAAHAQESERLRQIAAAGITPELFVRDVYIDHLLTGRRAAAEELVTETVTVQKRELREIIARMNKAEAQNRRRANASRYKERDSNRPQREVEELAGRLAAAKEEAITRRKEIKKLRRYIEELQEERDRAVAMLVGPAADAFRARLSQKSARCADASPQPARNRGTDSFRPIARAQ